MNKAARKYLWQVKKHLYCPGSQKKEFLRRLEDEILLYCETREKIDFIQLTAHFGSPENVAADFFTELDAKEMNRFAYMRLKFAYMILGVVSAVAFSILTVSIIDYAQTQKWLSGVPVMENYTFKDGNEYTRFWVRTNFRGKDVYWEYNSYLDGMFIIPQPEEADDTVPYAVDIYFYENGTMEHWTFGQDHMFWVRVIDT